MLVLVPKVRRSFLFAAAGAWCAACNADSAAIFSDVAADNGGTSAASGSAGKTTEGGSSSNGGSESAGGSMPRGGTNDQAGTKATGGSDEPGAGSGSGGTAGQEPGGGSGGTTENAGSGGTAGASGSGGSAASAGTSGSGGSTGSGGINNGAACPDVFGDYTIKNAEGNCHGLNQAATQSITGSVPQCLAHFASAPQEGGRGINGAGKLDATGAFTGAVLSLNDTQRTNCTGDWDPGNELITVKCGGLGELCTVVLQRN